MAIKYLDAKRIRGSSTGTKTSGDFEETFSSTGHTSDETTVSGWYAHDISGQKYDATNDNAYFNIADGTDDRLYYDLEAALGSSVNATTWTLRMKLNVTTLAGGQQDGVQYVVGLSDGTAHAGARDFMGVEIVQAHGTSAWNGVNNGTVNGGYPQNMLGTSNLLGASAVTLSSGTDWWLEIKRDGDDCICTLYEDEFTGTSYTKTLTVSGVTGLRYLFFGNYAGGQGSNSFIGSWDDIKFYDGGMTQDEKATLLTSLDSLGSTGDPTNNGATLDTATTVPSGLGTGCLDFDGSDYLDCSSLMPQVAMSTTGTVSFWFRPDAVSGDYLWSIGDTNGTDGRIYFEQQASNKWVVTCNNGGGALWKVDSTVETFTTNTWYHIVVTHDGGSSYGAVKLYINGVDRTTNSNNGTNWNNWMFHTGIDNMWFGGHSHNNNAGYGKADGRYKDIAIWNTALPFGTDENTAGSVKWLYNTGTGRTADTIPSGLRAHYKCDSATVTNAAPTATTDLAENILFEETDTRGVYWLQDNEWKASSWMFAGQTTPIWGTKAYWWQNGTTDKITESAMPVTTNAVAKADSTVSTGGENANFPTFTKLYSLGGNTINNIQEYTMGTTTASTDKADLRYAVGRCRAKAYDGTYGYQMGGFANPSTAYREIQSYTIGTTTTAIDKADLNRDTCNQAGGVYGKTYAYSVEGFSGSSNFVDIQEYAMGTTTTAVDKADGVSKRDISSIQNTTDLWTGDGTSNGITQYTMNTGTNATNHGNMSTHIQSYGSANSTTYGYWAEASGIYEYQMGSGTTITDKGDMTNGGSCPASGQGSP